jgi:hypothetical protein
MTSLHCAIPTGLAPATSYFLEEIPTTQETKPPRFTDSEIKRQLVNDSLGTVDAADFSGSDETKETGDAKKGNMKTRED